MALRIGIDLDGTLADLSRAYHAVDRQLFGKSRLESKPDQDETKGADVTPDLADGLAVAAAKDASRRRKQIWRAIRDTPDFWMSLQPIEPGAVQALYEATVEHHWEV